MKRKQRLKSALLIGTFIGLTACPVGVDRSMLIIHGAVPFEPGICALEGYRDSLLVHPKGFRSGFGANNCRLRAWHSPEFPIHDRAAPAQHQLSELWKRTHQQQH